MRRKFIITALSDKNNRFCVAGIDIQNNNHYRLCSDNAISCGAVDHYYLFYSDNTEMEVLDICEVDVIGGIPEEMQPENILVNWNTKPVYISKVTKEMLKHSLTQYSHVFYNLWRKVDPMNLKLNGDPMHSLELIGVDSLSIEYKIPHYGGNPKLYGSFMYNGICYEEISITDPKIKSLLYKKGLGSYVMKKPLILLSLGALYEGYNYKLIASVIV